ncbi:UDP-N-acetylmuramate dehydrogenase [Psychrobacter sp. DM4]|uniref:UDP-N-acetylmuramate dehydrogenase n=1 Tax=Psychrobacter sp. DM4 TaxID=3440637 RepID=UPI003F4F78DA
MNALRMSELKALFPDIITFKTCLSTFSQWRVGGVAEVIIRPRNKEELIKVRQWIYQNNVPSVIIGSTTNLLFADEGLQGVVVQIGSNFSKVHVHDSEITAEPGIWAPSLAKTAMQASLSGIEHICGIPGTLGGLVVMNGGSQRQGIGSVVNYVDTVDVAGNVKRYTKEECKFSYRRSIFQERDEVIIEVGLKLNDNQTKSAIRQEMLEILQSRRKKFPRKLPNCGSVFVSNPDMYATYGPPGKVIEDCGLKGLSRGGAQVSYLHANFIVNNGSAQAKDILSLINTVRETVHRRTGYQMVVEAKFVNSYGKIQDI